MKKCFLFSVAIIFVSIMGHDTNLEYGNYLPDYVSPISYPSASQLITFNPAKDKKIIYLAAFHTNDFYSIERDTIKKILTNERPDICILEGFPTKQGLSPEGVTALANESYPKKIGGENLFTAYHCDKLGIPFLGGEIADDHFYTQLVARGHSKKDIVFFMLLQQIPYWDRDNLLEIENQKKQFENFMHKVIADWFALEITYSFQEFLDWYQYHYNKAYSYLDFQWKIAQQDGWNDRSESASIHQKIGADAMNIRDNHIISVIKDCSERYDKVLVIFGATSTGNHYVWQKKALTSFLGEPVETKL